MRLLLVIILLWPASWLWGQPWVDTTYVIASQLDIPYGTAVDFGGQARLLDLDLSYPLDDVPPACGRPLLVMVHGGAFIAGDKADGTPRRIREDFAKRGYVTASVNYRLGQFHTAQDVHCNVSNLGVEWDCLNMTDSSEWYRAFFRGVQDVNGAIRYLVNRASDYNINPDNVFLVGESAGGFIALGAGFLDAEAEVLTELTDEKPAVNPPNARYEVNCVQRYGLGTSIADLTLARPALGSYAGENNLPLATPYRIRGVGNFYGAVFDNIFATMANDPPALYLYHQPSDLIVPYQGGKLFAGYAYCAAQPPFNCSYLINRPSVLGSRGIKDTLDNMAARGLVVPDYLFDGTTNNANCLQQLLDPALTGHAIDNYALRTHDLATFFATKIGACAVGITEAEGLVKKALIYPNPVTKGRDIWLLTSLERGDRIRLVGSDGRLQLDQVISTAGAGPYPLDLSHVTLTPGVYFLQLIRASGSESPQLLVAPN